MDMVEEHNAKGASFDMKLNEFADMSWDEFKASKIASGYNHQKWREFNKFNVEDLSNVTVPASVDWRQQNAVTGVKNQGQCGSCWAFSTTGSIEGITAIKTGQLKSLSEQQLVDCSTAEGNKGCQGGLMDQGFEYVIKNGGLCSESSYPYKASGPNNCQASSCSSVASISGYHDVPAKDQKSLTAAAAQQPVSVAIEADQSAFQFYSGGVFDASCGTKLDHGVLVVGYGTQNSKDYYIVKNSWGSSWGLSGYILMARNTQSSAGQCGIALSASYPTK